MARCNAAFPDGVLLDVKQAQIDHECPRERLSAQTREPARARGLVAGSRSEPGDSQPLRGFHERALGRGINPHVYGPLEREAVVGVRRVTRDGDGRFSGYEPMA